MAELVDTGERTTFDSGAMREVLEDKGRCDLLPLAIVGHMLDSQIIADIDNYVQTGDENCLYKALDRFVDSQCTSMPTAMLELAKHYQDGARKYADRNWEKGLPLHSFIDSGVRHYLKLLRGDTDEPHDRAFMWNIVGAIWTQKNHPECIDLPFADKK